MVETKEIIEWPPAGVKWYYSDEWVAIACADCREILPELPKVDLVLTDPPYGIGSIGGSKPVGSIGGSNIVFVNKYSPIVGDNKPFDPTFLLSVGSNQVIWGANYYSDKLPPSKGWIVWDKKLKNDWDDNFSDVELAWTSFDRPAKCYRLLFMGLIQEHNREKRVHPTQKPVELFQWIINKYSLVADIILDPFLGSGTTVIAAKHLNRKCIGIEIEEKYCEIAARRCSQGVFDFR